MLDLPIFRVPEKKKPNFEQIPLYIEVDDFFIEPLKNQPEEKEERGIYIIELI